MTMPDREKIGEAIRMCIALNSLMEKSTDLFNRKTFEYLKVLIEVAKHVQKHGLVLDEGEIEHIILEYMRPHKATTEFKIKELAKTIVERQLR